MSRRNKYLIAENFLMKPYKTDNSIRIIKRQIQELHLMMLPQAIDYSKPNIQSSTADQMTDKLCEYADRLKALEDKLLEKQKLYCEQCEEITEILDILEEVNSRGALILSHHYISHMPINQIAKEMHYDRVRVSQLKSIAMKDVQRILRNRNKTAV